jgi:DNA-binding MarR family transcriptional regulator
MEELVYEKIWFELSSKEKEIIALLIGKPEVKIMEIRENLSLSSGEMSVYRDRLKKKGIIDTSKHSYISFALPRFGEIISLWID